MARRLWNILIAGLVVAGRTVATRKRGFSLAGMGLAILLLACWAVVSGCPARPSGLPPVITPQPVPADGDALLMRVRLADGVSRITIGVDGPYRVMADNREVFNSAAALASTQLEVTGRNSWRLGARPLEGQRIEVLPARPGTLRLGGRNYDGFLRAIWWAGDELVAVNVVYVEDYVAGVVTGEMPANFGEEALKAQAVIARTYGLFEKTLHAGLEWDVAATQASQVYRGIESAQAGGGIGRRVTRATEGVVMVYGPPGQEGIFSTFYHSTCGGWSVSVEHVKPQFEAIEPLAGGVRCDWCTMSKVRNWATDSPVRIRKADFWPKLVASWPAIRELGPPSAVRVSEGRKSYGGRLTEILLVGPSGKSVALRGEDFRLKVGPGMDAMLSTMVHLQDAGDAILLSDGHGWGHGMGLCQYGAYGMARAGWSADRILRHYYPGALFKKAYDSRSD